MVTITSVLTARLLSAPQFLHHYRINHKNTPQLGRLLARIFAPVVLAPDDVDVDCQTEVSTILRPSSQTRSPL